MDNQPQIQGPQQAFVHNNSSPKGKTALWIFLVLLLIGAAAAGGWYYRDQQAKKDLTAKDQQISTITSENKDLKAKAEAKPVETEENPVPSDKVKENIEAAVQSKNYAAIKGYLNDSVTVIKAASDGSGARTPSQAVAELNFLKSATDPWNFDLSDETLKEYRANQYYAKYFPNGALVGKSADGYVVSFDFDSNGKIETIFIAAPEAFQN